MSSHQFTPSVGASLFAVFGVTFLLPLSISDNMDSEIPVILAMSAIFNPRRSANSRIFDNFSPFSNFTTSKVFSLKKLIFFLFREGVFDFPPVPVLDYLCRILFSPFPVRGAWIEITLM